MLGLAGRKLGVQLRFLDPAADACAARGRRAPRRRLRRSGAARSPCGGRRCGDVRVRERPGRCGASAWAPFPGAAALEEGQDRLREKQLFRRLGIPTAAFGTLDDTGVPAIVKTRRLGYDGKGQRRVDAVEPLGEDELAEALVRSTVSCRSWRCAVGTARRGSGRWPRTCTATGSCGSHAPRLRMRRRPRPRRSRAPCSTSSTTSACSPSSCSRSAGTLLANEFAPRVHNTAHWTIDGAETSQFENHLRAILGLPLGSTAARRAVGDGQPDRRRPRLDELELRSRTRTCTSMERSRGQDARSGTSRSSVRPRTWLRPSIALADSAAS